MRHAVDIQEKVICITGGLGQIGRTIAHSFLQQGARVVLGDISLDRAEAFMQDHTSDQENILITSLDICDPDSCQKFIENAHAAFGKIDVLIHAAAIDAKFDAEHADSVHTGRFEQFPLEKLRVSIEVNITGTIILTQEMIKYMLAQGRGNIILVASTYALVAPNPALCDRGDGVKRYKPVDYVATKSFIPNFTRYLATTYAADHIRCNAIAPHGVFNDHDTSFVKHFTQLSPMGRMADAEELAGPFTFLASDASSYMTGSILTVDGGWTAW